MNRKITLFAFGAMQGGMDVTMNAWAGEVEKATGKPSTPRKG